MRTTIRTLRTLCRLAALAVLLSVPAFAQEPPPTIEAKTAGMTAISGFIPLYWDEATGELYMEFGALEEEFLYQVSLASGLGSAPVRLDRGQLGMNAILRPTRIGPQVLLMETNYRYRAVNDNYIGAGAHPLTSVWDNGDDLVRHLEREIEIRQAGLDAFGERVIRPGEALSLLEPVLVPLYLHHRFQMKAAMNTIGGQEYYYAVRGDGQRPVAPLPGDRQRDALEVVLRTLETDFLALPERIVKMIPPPAYREAGGETFDGHTGLVFDPLAAVDSAADYTVLLLLHPERMARLVNNHALDPGQPGLGEVLDRLTEKTWGAEEPADSYRRAVQDAAERSVLNGLLREAMNPDNPARVRALIEDRLTQLGGVLTGMSDPSPHERLAAADIRRFLNRKESLDPDARRPTLPRGAPIGADASGVWPRPQR